MKFWIRDLCAGTCLLAAALATSAGAAAAQNPKIDLSRLVVIGDSLSAGYQNDSLMSTQQVNGYAAVLARQARANMVLPLIAPPGIPNALISPFGDRLPGLSTGRIDWSKPVTNLAVPGARVRDAVVRFQSDNSPVGDLFATFNLLVLGPVGTPVDIAVTMQPTTAIVWLGSNDAMLPATLLGEAWVTDPVQLAQDYEQVLSRLKNTGAKLVVANIPDVFAVPAFTPVEAVAQKAGIPLQVFCPAVTGMLDCAGSYLNPAGAAAVGGILAALAGGGSPAPLTDAMLVDSSEAAIINNAVAAYNSTIKSLAAKYGATLVDIRTLVNDMKQNGKVVAGRKLTTAFMGGLFSLDGTHPTNVGYALIANEFIKTLNRQNAAGIPPADIDDVAQEDPPLPAKQ